MVGNDPCELRIVTPAGEPAWKAQAIEVSSSDATAGVSAGFVQQDRLVRATIEPRISREVSWVVKFD